MNEKQLAVAVQKLAVMHQDAPGQDMLGDTLRAIHLLTEELKRAKQKHAFDLRAHIFACGESDRLRRDRDDLRRQLKARTASLDDANKELGEPNEDILQS